MSEYKYLIALSVRLYTRVLYTTVLALVSLMICAMALTVVWGIMTETERFVRAEQKVMVGGDVRLLAQEPIPQDIFTQTAFYPEAVTQVTTFTGLLAYATSSVATVEFRAVDPAYPLYGSLELMEGVYYPLQADEIILDISLAERWGVDRGSSVRMGTVAYRIRDFASKYPDSGIRAFEFFPRVLISQEGLERSGLLDTTLRAEYERLYRIEDAQSVPRVEMQAIADDAGYRLRLSDSENSRAFSGLAMVQTFLGIVVLCTLLLGLINMYASTLYVCERHAHTVATLSALGLTRMHALVPVALMLVYSLALALVVGGLGGSLILTLLERAVDTYFNLTVSFEVTIQQVGFVFALIAGLAIPVTSACVYEQLHRDDKVEPRIRNLHRGVFGVLILIPMCVLTYVFMEDVFTGGLIILAILVAYVLIAVLYVRMLAYVYARRHLFSFFWRSIIAWKRYDGIFGVVAFASLFSALCIFFFLSLTFSSATKYLREDLGVTAPHVYVLDIQESQSERVRSQFTDMVLIPTTRARLVSVNDVPAEAYITERVGGGVAGEVRREFIITSTTSIPVRDQEGDSLVPFATPGYVSVDEDFRDRMGLRLGDRLSFLVQGFRQEVVIGHIRVSDTSSGLPFFYFIFSPADVVGYTQTYFGYAFYDKEQIMALQSYSAEHLPNVSIINTENAQAYVQSLLTFAEAVMMIATIPLLALSGVLILALMIEQYHIRQRDAVRLLVLGAEPSMVWTRLTIEMISTTFLAMFFAYAVACLGAWYVVTHVLELPSLTMVDSSIIYGGMVLVCFVLGIQYIRSRNSRDVYDALIHEDNY